MTAAEHTCPSALRLLHPPLPGALRPYRGSVGLDCGLAGFLRGRSWDDASRFGKVKRCQSQSSPNRRDAKPGLTVFIGRLTIRSPTRDLGIHVVLKLEVAAILSRRVRIWHSHRTVEVYFGKGSARVNQL